MNSLQIDKSPQQTRVVVAMSGGVDSSTAAALLKAQGYEVIGVTLQLYDQNEKQSGGCCAGQDILDARRVADELNIPYYVLDYEQKFQETVIQDFVSSYENGQTPNPCVRCNQTVKFSDLLSTSREIGADVLVTGHYARAKQSPSLGLYRAVDSSRDQSYFLFTLTRDQLKRVRFPLGKMRKIETRALAAQLGVTTAHKAESQDICFVSTGSYADVVKRLRPNAAQPGPIVHIDGRTLGRHPGLLHYTIGQRRRLGIDDHNGPLYVIRLDKKENRVIVGPLSALYRDRLFLSGMNWLDETSTETLDQIEIQFRSRQIPIPATLTRYADNGAMVVLKTPQYAGIAPGQACVVYRGERLLGGGWISDQPSL